MKRTTSLTLGVVAALTMAFSLIIGVAGPVQAAPVDDGPVSSEASIPAEGAGEGANEPAPNDSLPPVSESRVSPLPSSGPQEVGTVYAADAAFRGPCNYSGSHPLLQLTSPYTQGAPVVHLQCLLRNLHGFSGLVVDGIFGPSTDTAVRLFQWTNGLTVDGKVGTLTWDALHP